MGMSRSQVSQQIVYLLQQTGKLGATSSAFESSEPAENFIASGLTLPIAVVETPEGGDDRDNPARIEMNRFRVSVLGQSVTETMKSNYLASGGSASSQHKLESVIRDLIAGMSTVGGIFVGSDQAFQGRVSRIGAERLIPAQGTTYVVADFDIEVSDTTFADNYDAPRVFKASPGTSHSINLSWVNPPARFDQYQNVVRRGNNPGDPAPTSPSGGTGIAITGGVLGTTATDSSPAGSGLTYNYAAFRTYNSGANNSAAMIASATTT